MCQVNNERERNILGEEKDQIGREPIWWRRRKEKEKEKKEERKEKEKEKEREKKRKIKKEGECVRVRGKKDGERRKKKKRERHFPSRSLVNRWSKCVGARDKVGPCNKSYAWVSKSEFFVEALRGKGFLLYQFLFT